MNYTQEMNLQSKSGYCMPFEERKGEVRMSLDYGTQVHPKTGEEFFHHGIDFITKHYLLSACADGIVSGIGSWRCPRGRRFQRQNPPRSGHSGRQSAASPAHEGGQCFLS